MWKDAYLESRVLSADPMELVCLLYQNAVESVQAARGYLAAGDIAARSNAVCRALDLIGELEGSLDHSVGGEISRNLAGLYQYMQRRLTEGNLQKKDGPLADVESLLASLLDGWRAARAEVAPRFTPPVACPEPPMTTAWQDMASSSAHTWSA